MDLNCPTAVVLTAAIIMSGLIVLLIVSGRQ